MIIAVTNRKTGEVEMFDVNSVVDISRDSRTIVKFIFNNGEQDTLEVGLYKIDIMPRIAS